MLLIFYTRLLNFIVMHQLKFESFCHHYLLDHQKFIFGALREHNICWTSSNVGPCRVSRCYFDVFLAQWVKKVYNLHGHADVDT